ncbi:MAG TPA: helix-turn-helix transcriptional regulator [Castellaniella sp.]|uniref:helix-turn-helix transcriptional regulator n=1 Tax=Castellaniella sp. TaxID=1955812 RepID=UPI002F23C2DE
MKHLRTDIRLAADSGVGAPDDAIPETLPRPVYGGLDRHPNIVHARRHRHQWAQLSYTIQGHLQVWTPSARFVALPQRAVWIPPNLLHQVQQSTQAVIRSLYLDTEALGLKWSECRVLAISPLLHELIRAFSLLPAEYDLDGAEGRLVRVLIDELAKAPEAGLILPWPADPRLHSICRQLQNNPDDRASLSLFSTRLGVSEKTLTRLFQQQTGLGFRLWRQRARLMHALPLLEQGERITDVALACGYESLSSFIATFREHTGTTPGDFAAHNLEGK